MKSYSQCGQDLFVFSLLGEDGTFLDLGCYLPQKINNTYLLEERGWTGISLDIEDYSNEWKIRKNRFLQKDCMSINYTDFLKENYPTQGCVIDYLSIDMEVLGDRYKLLDKVLNSGFKFKIITIEHDSHLGESFIREEKNKQIELLQSLGYYLLCDDVSNYKNPEMFYEDWWINPDFINTKDYSSWQCRKLSCPEIFAKNGVQYSIDEISSSWDDYKLK